MADFQTIVNASIAASPNCKIYLTKVWSRAAQDADVIAFAANVDTVVAANPANVFVGVDEAITLEGGDDGATNTTDGTHMSAAGGIAWAAAMMTILGY